MADRRVRPDGGADGNSRYFLATEPSRGNNNCRFHNFGSKFFAVFPDAMRRTDPGRRAKDARMTIQSDRVLAGVISPIAHNRGLLQGS